MSLPEPLPASPSIAIEVDGVTFRPATRNPASVEWEGYVGDYYRVSVAKFMGLFIATIYRLDPKFKAFDPLRSRTSQECTLMALHPHGDTQRAIMERAVKMARDHERVYGPEFLAAEVIKGSELQVGMRLHIKGRFFSVSHLIPRAGRLIPQVSDGWTVLLRKREYPEWIKNDTDCTITRKL